MQLSYRANFGWDSHKGNIAKVARLSGRQDGDLSAGSLGEGVKARSRSCRCARKVTALAVSSRCVKPRTRPPHGPRFSGGMVQSTSFRAASAGNG